MAHEFNPNPWQRTDRYIDRTYPSGVARERPIATTRIHCEPDDDAVGEAHVGPERVELFNRQLREGHAGRNRGEE
jgi:hypothetical protein